MKPHQEILLRIIEAQGWKGQMVSTIHLAELRDAIVEKYENGLINEALYQEKLNFFSFKLPVNFPDACSIIIVAAPTPEMRVVFNWQGQRRPVIVPPTYVSYRQRTGHIQAVLEDWLLKQGYHLEKPELPLKTLAVRSGLAEYGRNNITYVPGMGSFFQLAAAYTDLPCDDAWREPKMLNRCGKCFACLQHCPTGAIVKDRFLLHAERCLTYHNEAERDFPDWIDPSAHHCLVGCMRCQLICPENRAVKDWFEDRVEFFDQETALFIQGVPFEELPEKTATKLKSLEINEKYASLCRNLTMILGH